MQIKIGKICKRLSMKLQRKKHINQLLLIKLWQKEINKKRNTPIEYKNKRKLMTSRKSKIIKKNKSVHFHPKLTQN